MIAFDSYLLAWTEKREGTVRGVACTATMNERAVARLEFRKLANRRDVVAINLHGCGALAGALPRQKLLGFQRSRGGLWHLDEKAFSTYEQVHLVRAGVMGAQRCVSEAALAELGIVAEPTPPQVAPAPEPEPSIQHGSTMDQVEQVAPPKSEPAPTYRLRVTWGQHDVSTHYTGDLMELEQRLQKCSLGLGLESWGATRGLVPDRAGKRPERAVIERRNPQFAADSDEGWTSIQFFCGALPGSFADQTLHQEHKRANWGRMYNMGGKKLAVLAAGNLVSGKMIADQYRKAAPFMSNFLAQQEAAVRGMADMRALQFVGMARHARLSADGVRVMVRRLGRYRAGRIYSSFTMRGDTELAMDKVAMADTLQLFDAYARDSCTDEGKIEVCALKGDHAIGETTVLASFGPWAQGDLALGRRWHWELGSLHVQDSRIVMTLAEAHKDGVRAAADEGVRTGRFSSTMPTQTADEAVQEAVQEAARQAALPYKFEVASFDARGRESGATLRFERMENAVVAFWTRVREGRMWKVLIRRVVPTGQAAGEELRRWTSTGGVKYEGELARERLVRETDELANGGDWTRRAF